MTNEVIRNNGVVHSSKVDVFDFEEQGGFRVPQDPFTVSPGDAFRTSCYYRDGGAFGLSSQEEMCIAYVLYYPAISNFGFNWACPYGLNAPICNQELESIDLTGEADLNRVFGSSGGVCPAETPAPSIPVAPTTSPATTPPPTETNDESSPTISPTRVPVSESPPPTRLPTDLSESSQPPTEAQDESPPTVSNTQMPVSEASLPPTFIPTTLNLPSRSPTQDRGDDSPTTSSPEQPTNGKSDKRHGFMATLRITPHPNFEYVVTDSATGHTRTRMLLWTSTMCTLLALL